MEKEIIADAKVYTEELNTHSDYQVTPQKQKEVAQHHAWKKEAYQGMPGHRKTFQIDEDGEEIRPKFLSNHTHYSPTDPDAKISTKPGKPRQLNYAGQLSVDDAHHVITGACASTAGSKDSAIPIINPNYGYSKGDPFFTKNRPSSTQFQPELASQFST